LSDSPGGGEQAERKEGPLRKEVGKPLRLSFGSRRSVSFNRLEVKGGKGGKPIRRHGKPIPRARKKRTERRKKKKKGKENHLSLKKSKKTQDVPKKKKEKKVCDYKGGKKGKRQCAVPTGGVKGHWFPRPHRPMFSKRGKNRGSPNLGVIYRQGNAFAFGASGGKKGGEGGGAGSNTDGTEEKVPSPACCLFEKKTKTSVVPDRKERRKPIELEKKQKTLNNREVKNPVRRKKKFSKRCVYHQRKNKKTSGVSRSQTTGSRSPKRREGGRDR